MNNKNNPNPEKLDNDTKHLDALKSPLNDIESKKETRKEAKEKSE